MTKVQWADDALLDIEQHIGYIALFNPVAAAKMAEQLLEAGNSLTIFPHRGRRGSISGTLELTAVHPFIVVYEIGREGVVILRVWHGAQDRDDK